MIYELNGKLMSTILVDNSSEMLLENILAFMENETFCKDKAAKIVGGEKKLESLIRSGEIRAEKLTAKQNGKWFCKASDVLRHCVVKKKKKLAKNKCS